MQFNVLGLLPPANEVWGKVIFSQACVKNSVHGGGGGLGFCSREEGGACLGEGVPAPGGEGSAPGGGGCLVETPPRDGYCCGRYASYWNAFLYCSDFNDTLHLCQEF